MLKRVFPVTLAFDCEWIPDAPAIRRTFGIDPSVPDAEAVERAWADARKSPDEAQPFLKLALCRIVSVCAVVRKQNNSEVDLKIITIPGLDDIASWDEAKIIRSFLLGVGKNSAQLVGYNCITSDIPALMQRALVNRISSPEFARRPDKPWEGNDYFSSFSDSVFDIAKTVSSGRLMPTLHQLATACRIPGKLDVLGTQVYDLWVAGSYREIIEYNVFDALTTYLLWLRCCLFAGLLSATDHEQEEARLRSLLETEMSKGNGYLERYLSAWSQLQNSG